VHPELRRLAAAHQFRMGIALVSPDLRHDLDAWLAAPGSPPAPELERALVNYLGRMAAKTSPLSTFLYSAEGEWAAGAAWLLLPDPAERCVSVEVNRGILALLASTLADWPELRDRLVVRTVPGLVSDGATLRFVSWSLRNGESIHRVDAPPALRKVIQRLRRSGPQPLRALPGSESMWLRLGEAGLLEIDFGIPDDHPAWLEQLLERLERVESSRVSEVRAELHLLSQALVALPNETTVEGRVRLIDDIHRAMERIRPLADRVHGPNKPAIKNVLYENCVLTGKARLGGGAWEPPLEDLALAADFAALYDPHLPGRLAAAALFEWRYGPGVQVPLLDFYELFAAAHAASFEGAPVLPAAIMRALRSQAADLDAPLPELAELRRLRAVPLTWLDTSSVAVASLDRSLVREHVRSYPAWVARPAAVEAYCQAWAGDGGVELVLNALQSGDGRLLARLRFMRGLAGAPSPNGPTCPTPPDDGSVLADICGVFGNNSNLRLAATPYEIAFPGCVSRRPLEERLELDDLTIELDAERRRLCLTSSRAARPVQPVHMGMEAEFLLPPLAQFIVSVFGDFAASPLASLRILDAGERQIPEALVHRPRLQLGRVVLGRAAWVAPPASVPLGDRSRPAFERALIVESWRRRHEVPPRCYVRSGEITALGPVPDQLTFALAMRRNKARKPVYVDFESPLFIPVFERAVRDAGRVLLIEEALPGEDDLLARFGGEGHACEFIFTIRKGAR
jgi:hypothetical protein